MQLREAEAVLWIPLNALSRLDLDVDRTAVAEYSRVYTARTGANYMPIRSFDHVAIPIQNTAAMLAFYRALGFGVNERENFYSIHFGDQKINFHAPERWQGGRFTLRGPTAVPGCGDFCFVWDGSAESLKSTLDQAGAKIIEGPIERQGGRDNGRAKATSVYVRDPDSNLLEFMIYPDDSAVQ